MKASFIELPPFERLRVDHLTDDNFLKFQLMLMENPLKGDVIQQTGGLRKVRFEDEKRGKGKRGGIRVIYYWYLNESLFYLFTLYDKDEKDDLTKQQRDTLRNVLENIKERK
jgi:hypothetical protein